MSEEIKAAWQAILAAGILGGIFGALLASILNHWLTSRRESRSGIKAEKMKILPLIDGFIKMTANCEGYFGMVRHQIQDRRLFDLAMRFRLHLKGERLRAFNEAWEALDNTKRDEIHDGQYDTKPEELEKMGKTLASRLEALRKIVIES